MAVKILLKRKVPDDKADELKSLINELRSLTNGQPGYVSGETLKRLDKPGEILVISKWKTAAYWKQWFASQQRADIQNKIDALLGSETEYEVYDYD